MNEEFITKLLAELFDFPCNFSPCEEELHNSEENCVWCEEHCNKCDAADCWMHYFEVKFAEKGMSVDTLIALTESVDEQLSELPQRLLFHWGWQSYEGLSFIYQLRESLPRKHRSRSME